MLADDRLRGCEPFPVGPSRLRPLSGERIFISNTDSDGERSCIGRCPVLNLQQVSMRQCKSWAAISIVDRPADADLIFEVNYREPWEFIMPKMLYPFTPVKDPCNPYQDYHDYPAQGQSGYLEHRGVASSWAHTLQPIKPDPTWIDSLELHLQARILTRRLQRSCGSRGDGQ